MRWLTHGIHRAEEHGWTYTWPWALTNTWQLRFGVSGDELCNPTAYIQLPFLGMFVRWPEWRRRTEADGPCLICREDMAEDAAEGWKVSWPY